MELREKIFTKLCALRGSDDEREETADAILAIPEIRDALNGVRPVGGYWERTGTGKGARKWVPAP